MPLGKKYFQALNLLALASSFVQTKTNNLLTPTKFDLRKYLYSFVVFLFSVFFFIFIPMNLSFKSFAKKFPYFLIVSC